MAAPGAKYVQILYSQLLMYFNWKMQLQVICAVGLLRWRNKAKDKEQFARKYNTFLASSDNEAI